MDCDEDVVIYLVEQIGALHATPAAKAVLSPSGKRQMGQRGPGAERPQSDLYQILIHLSPYDENVTLS